MRNYLSTSGVAVLIALGSLGASAAHAAYYVRPYVEVGSAIIDGYTQNGATTASSAYSPDQHATVDLATGTVKAYLSTQGSNTFAQVAGTMGDTLSFSPNAAGTTVNVNFAFDGTLLSRGSAAGLDPSVQFGLYATLYVYEAGSGVNHLSYGSADYRQYEVVAQSRFLSFSPDEDFSQALADVLTGSFTVDSGSYEIFTGLSIFARTGDQPASIELDFLNTGTLGLQTTEGVGYTAEGGLLLSDVGNPGDAAPGADDTTLPRVAVPAPASWALLLAGLGLAGISRRSMRQRAGSGAPSRTARSLPQPTRSGC